MKANPESAAPPSGTPSDFHGADGHVGASGIASAPSAACRPTTNTPAARAATVAGHCPIRSRGGCIVAPNAPTPAQSASNNAPTSDDATAPSTFIVSCEASGSVVDRFIATVGHAFAAEQRAM